MWVSVLLLSSVLYDEEDVSGVEAKAGDGHRETAGSLHSGLGLYLGLGEGEGLVEGHA